MDIWNLACHGNLKNEKSDNKYGRYDFVRKKVQMLELLLLP